MWLLYIFCNVIVIQVVILRLHDVHHLFKRNGLNMWLIRNGFFHFCFGTSVFLVSAVYLHEKAVVGARHMVYLHLW